MGRRRRSARLAGGRPHSCMIHIERLHFSGTLLLPEQFTHAPHVHHSSQGPLMMRSSASWTVAPKPLAERPDERRTGSPDRKCLSGNLTVQMAGIEHVCPGGRGLELQVPSHHIARPVPQNCTVTMASTGSDFRRLIHPRLASIRLFTMTVQAGTTHANLSSAPSPAASIQPP